MNRRWPPGQCAVEHMGPNDVDMSGANRHSIGPPLSNRSSLPV